ncbi:Terpene synthase family, metal binding domain [Chitinophaga sp. CF118]|uniref:terpene synthase family protein n=1 Tax=Chitinophaga sp. CF118 TaxID=1884367 RepID=UPI0008E9A8E8|nr:hypothetical protein [Chitinophaga sp. CF118]SFD02387.1 Terpene synthase family, metal binding domain [Chitinophaga sp. CF118]
MQVVIPRLYCPFPSRINPLVHVADEHTTQWVRQFQLVPSHEILEFYQQQKFAWMVARMFPNADQDALCAFCDLNTYLFFLDDLFDHPGAQSEFNGKDKFRYFVKRLVDILRNNEEPSLEKDGAMFAALGDLWQRLKKMSDTSWQQQFIDGIIAIFEAAVWQFENERQQVLPSLTDYMQKRQYLGAANVATDTIPVAERIALPGYVYHHQLVHRLTELCRNTVCWANDLFSFSKEIEHLDKYNMVAILQRENNLSLDDAIMATVRIHDEQVEEFIALSKKAAIFDEAENTALSNYINALAALMRGNIDWSVNETSRYSFIYHDEPSLGAGVYQLKRGNR